MNTVLPPPICLIKPPAAECFRFATTSITPPLGLAYIAGALESAGHAVTVIDAIALAPATHRKYLQGYLVGLPLRDIPKHIPPSTRIIGISAIFTHEWPAVVHLIDLIAAKFPDAAIIVGGEHVTSMPEFSLATSKAHVLVLGEGEETILELVAAMQNNLALDSIPGIAFRKGNSIHVTPRRARKIALDNIPLPAWHHFNLRAYHDYHFQGGLYSSQLSVPILATRGCPYQCTYCSAPNMWSPLWIPRDPVQVVDEIERYMRDYGARNFPFQDLTAIIKKDWIIAFCKEVIARGLDISWQMPSGTRSEAIDENVAALLKRSGMINMSYAPESGSERTRILIKKKMHTDSLMHSIRAAAGADLTVTIFLVYGFPHDDESSLAENIEFVKNVADSGIQDISIGFYMALPGTELFHSLYKNGKITINRDYFTHILSSNSLLPAASFCEQLTRRQLAYWKIRTYWQFYRHKSRLAKGQPSGLLHILKGFVNFDHQTKLQSALRNGMRSLWYSLVAYVQPHWVSRERERHFFEGWDELYRKIERSNEATGLRQDVHADYTEIHHSNVIKPLKVEHGQARMFQL